MKPVAMEGASLGRVFWLNESNSHAEKIATWVVGALVLVGGVGHLTGYYSPDPATWKTVWAAFLVMFGRVWGRERERLGGV